MVLSQMGADERVSDQPNPVVVVRILREVAEALHSLHKLGILHRDVADRNVLCDGEYNIKLADFGLSKFVGVPGGVDLSAGYKKNYHSASMLYPAASMAPEALDEPAVYSNASDVWSFGMLVYQCIANADPYEHIHPESSTLEAAASANLKLICAIKEGNFPDMSKVNTSVFPEELIQTMTDCWAMDPAIRISLPAIIDRLRCVEDSSWSAARFRPTMRSFAEMEAKWFSDLKNTYQELNVDKLKNLSIDDTTRKEVGSYTYEQWKKKMDLVKRRTSPSMFLEEATLKKFGSQRPFDIFWIHTGAQKKSEVSSMREIFEHGGFRGFLDKNSIEGRRGSPPRQMRLCLEICRFAVAVVSKAFLQREEPCAELEYAYSRMTWIRQSLTEEQRWESMWVVLLDLTLEEYKYFRAETRPSLPPIPNQVKVWFYQSGFGEYDSIVTLSHALKLDLHDCDTNGGTVDNWKNFLQTWPDSHCGEEASAFPRACNLYTKTEHLSEEESSAFLRSTTGHVDRSSIQQKRKKRAAHMQSRQTNDWDEESLRRVERGSHCAQ